MINSKLMKKKILCSLLIIVIFLALFTWLIVLQNFYVFQYSGNIKLHPQFSWSNLLSKFLTNWGLFLSLISFFGLGILFYKFISDKNEFIKIEPSQELMITQTFWYILKENIWESILFLLIIIIILVNIATWVEDISKTSPTSLVPTLFGLLLTILSLIITAIGIYYAFLAERKSAKTLENSMALLNERADFLEHFAGFINRINRKIEGPGGLRSDICEDQKNEQHYYFIKCMFLTPFLGHAGITEFNTEMYDSFNKFTKNIGALIESEFCEVKYLIPQTESVVCWYSQIQWIEHLKNKIDEKKKLDPGVHHFKDLNDIDKEQIIANVKRKITEEKGSGQLVIRDKNNKVYGAVDSYNQLCKDYEDSYKNNKLEVCHANNIPFQLFLVTKPTIINHDKFPSKDSFKLKNGKPKEEGVFVVLTFVGDETYTELIRDIIDDSDPNLRDDGGIDDLLKNLHSAFYSEDPRVCKILNNHFMHYWDKHCVIKHHPEIAEDIWTNVDINNCLYNKRFTKVKP